MKIPLAYYGDPVLRTKTKPVEEITDEIAQLIQDMFETMHAHNGIGLAAPQVHLSISLFVCQVPVEQEDGSYAEGIKRVFINPKILSISDETYTQEEGCLSIPGIYGDVERPLSIKVSAQDLNGEFFEQEFHGLEARCILHENDHINGVLFLDRMKKNDRKALSDGLKTVKKKYYKKK
jgi:peptide deformylase